jgi:hypothetical protein
MSGEVNSQAKEKMSFTDKLLDDYELTSKLPPLSPPGDDEELQSYLNMDRESIEKLTPKQSISIAYRLGSFSVYFQRLYNREKSRVTWAETELHKSVAAVINDYDKFMKFDVKVAVIARENTYVSSVMDILRYAKQRTDRLEYVASSLKSLENTLLNNARLKENNNE